MVNNRESVLAGERGAHEPLGLVWREAEEDLLKKIVGQQRRRWGRHGARAEARASPDRSRSTLESQFFSGRRVAAAFSREGKGERTIGAEARASLRERTCGRVSTRFRSSLGLGNPERPRGSCKRGLGKFSSFHGLIPEPFQTRTGLACAHPCAAAVS